MKTLRIDAAVVFISGSMFIAEPSAGQSPEVIETPTVETIRTELAKKWPKRGAIFAEYTSTAVPEQQWQREAAFHFESNAWYLLRVDGMNMTVGVDPSGVQYSGRPKDTSLRPRAKPESGWSSRIDPMFPGFMLRELLKDSPDDCSIAREEDQGLRLVFSLPRGMRGLRLEELPQAEVERWGGSERLQRDFVVRVDRDLMVTELSGPLRSTEIGSERPLVPVDAFACEGAGGFQVSGRCPPPLETVEIISCRYDPAATREMFEMHAVEKRWIERRIALPNRRPVEYPDSAKTETVPIDGGRRASFGSAAFILAGCTLLVIGVIAWIRNRGK